MKEFWIYTGLRLLVFVGSFLVVLGIYDLVASSDSVNILVVLVLSFVLSGAASYVLLKRQRVAFAQRVEARAGRITERYEEMRAREDAEED